MAGAVKGEERKCEGGAVVKDEEEEDLGQV